MSQQNFPAPRAFYTVEAVANLLGYSTKSVRRWIESGRLRAYRVGRDLRISSKDLQDLLERSRI